MAASPSTKDADQYVGRAMPTANCEIQPIRTGRVGARDEHRKRAGERRSIDRDRRHRLPTSTPKLIVLAVGSLPAPP